MYISQQKHFNHILGCLSCISVTKECYQIGFLESSLSLFQSPSISQPHLSEDLFLHSWHYYHNHATKQLSMQGQLCRIKERNNKPHQKC